MTRTELLETFALAAMNADRAQRGLPSLAALPRLENSGDPLPALRAGFAALANVSDQMDYDQTEPGEPAAFLDWIATPD
jgi:hypothetical protein